MPLVDLEIVGDATAAPEGLAQTLADEAGRIFGAAPGTTWVRVRMLDPRGYAESGAAVGIAERPVFVTVTKRQPPAGAALTEEASALTSAVARLVGWPVARVHVIYAPAAAGRIMFGGVLVEAGR